MGADFGVKILKMRFILSFVKDIYFIDISPVL